jgi:hypothetical protein
VGVGGELAPEVAEVVLDLAEGFVLGEIDELLGHLAEGGFGLRPQDSEEGLDAGFSVISGRQRGGSRGV